MEQDKYYFRVGLFISLVIVGAIITLGWLASNRSTAPQLTYAIYFNGSVNGLSIGSPVKLKGIEIGSVKQIKFSSYEDDQILVLADIDNDAPIRKDTKASLQLQGITGTSMISLENTNDPKAPIEYLRLKEGKEYLVIESKQSGLEKVFTTIPELVEELKKLGVQGQKLLSDENIKQVNNTMKDMQALLAEGKVTMREVKMLAKTIREDPSQIIRGPKYEGYEVKK